LFKVKSVLTTEITLRSTNVTSIFLSLHFKGVSWKYINVLSIKSFHALKNDFKALLTIFMCSCWKDVARPGNHE